MKRRAATRREHLRFCEIEGWRPVVSARSSANRHHMTFELPLDDGRILRTRISRPANSENYGKALWSHILRDQLSVTAKDFWDCVDDGRPPQRSAARPTTASSALPARIAYQLVHVLHLDADEVAALSIEEATSLLETHWSTTND